MSPNNAEDPSEQRQASTHQQPSHFTKFPKLPLELRCRVWYYAASFPRIVGLRSGKNFVHGIAPCCPFGRVSKEAQVEMRRLRQPLYDPQGYLEAPKIYVNLEIDTIWLTDRATWSQLATTAFKEVRSLAINDNLWNIEQQDQPLAPGCLSKTDLVLYLGVKEVLVVFNNTPGVMDANDTLAFIEPRSSPQLLSRIRRARTASTWEIEEAKDAAILELSRSTVINVWRMSGKSEQELKATGFNDSAQLKAWIVPSVKYVEVVKVSSAQGT